MRNKRILTLVFTVAFLTLLVGCIPQPTNQVPVITSIPITAVDLGETYTYDVNATDPDGDTLTYSLDVKPTGMTINSATGLVKWKPTKKGNYAVVVEVSDGDLDITQSFTIVVSKVEPGYIPPCPTPPPTPTPSAQLTSIVVEPKEMTLFVGGSEKIVSVTATYEIKGFEVPVLPGDCTFLTTNKDIATVEKGNFGEVTVTAEGVGTATIIVNYGGKTDTITVTVSELVSKTITVRWLEDAVSFYPDDNSTWGSWLNDPIPPDDRKPATLIQDNGGWCFADTYEYYNFLITPEAGLEGSIVISATGDLSGYATYTYNELPTKDILVGQVEITIYDDGVYRDHDGTMVGTYTQWTYKFGTEEDVIAKYSRAVRCEGFDDKWLVRYADYTAHGEVPTH